MFFGQSSPLSGSQGIIGTALRDGILSAFHEINEGGSLYDCRLHLWSLDDGYSVDKAVENTIHLVRENVFGLIGFFGSTISSAISELAASRRLPFVGPVSGMMSLRLNNSFAINIRASYLDEMNALIHYAASLRGVTRFSIFFQRDTFGQLGLSAIVSALSALGLPLMSNGSYDPVNPNVQKRFSEVFNVTMLPQAVVVWAFETVALEFIRQAKLTTYGGNKMMFLCPSVVGNAFAGHMNNVYVSQVLPPLSDTTRPVVQQFLQAFAKSNPDAVPSMYSFEGYISGRLAAAVMSRMPLSQQVSSEAFTNTIYTDRFFDIGTLEVGPFSRDSCNQGSRIVWITDAENGTMLSVPKSTYQFAECGSNPETTLYQPLNFGFFFVGQPVLVLGEADGIVSAFSEGNANRAFKKFHLHLVELKLVPDDNDETLMQKINQFLQENDIFAFVTDIREPRLLSLIFRATAETKKLLVGIHGPPCPSAHLPFSPYRIFLGGSPLDESFAILRYISQYLRLKRVGLLFEDGEAGAELFRSVTIAAEEYDITLVSSVCVHRNAENDAIDQLLASNSVQAIVLSGPVQAVDMVSLLKACGLTVPIFLLEDDADRYFEQQDVIRTEFENVYVSHFVPSPTSTTFPVSVAARQSLINTFGPISVFTFSSLEGYMAGLFLSTLVNLMPTNNSEDLAKLVFKTRFFDLDPPMGPFFDSSCQMLSNNKTNCECDLGARDVWLYRFMTNGSQLFEEVSGGRLRFDSCEVMPSIIQNATTAGVFAATNQLLYGVETRIFIVIIVISMVFSCAVMSVVLVLCARRRRKIAALLLAPKGSIALVFTDVQDSTKLWDVCPSAMHEALDTHNEILRAAIVKHQGYEVKTQGDSFMVAFSDVFSAVAWSLDIQELLLDAEWPEDILCQSCCEVVTACDNGDIQIMFRGLRVRVGIHCGIPELEYNARTNSIDYFGPMVNCAARIEALGSGGQILISVDTRAFLEGGPTDDIMFTSLGIFPLKGMAAKQEIIQISSKRLSGRTFPPIEASKVEMLERKVLIQRCNVCNRLLECSKCNEPPSFRGNSSVREPPSSMSNMSRFSAMNGAFRRSSFPPNPLAIQTCAAVMQMSMHSVNSGVFPLTESVDQGSG